MAAYYAAVRAYTIMYAAVVGGLDQQLLIISIVFIVTKSTLVPRILSITQNLKILGTMSYKKLDVLAARLITMLGKRLCCIINPMDCYVCDKPGSMCEHCIKKILASETFVGSHVCKECAKHK